MAKGGVEISSPATNKNVTLRKVENGYTVSTWDDKKSKDLVYIAKDLDDAQEIMNDILE